MADSEQIKSQRAKLMNISRTWKKMFKVDLMIGFPVNPKHIPLLERCISKEDPSEFNEWLSAEIQLKKEKRWLW